MLGLRPDALQPGAEVRVTAEIEPTFMSHMSVGAQSDIRDQIALADEEGVTGEVLFHNIESRVTKRPLLWQCGPTLLRQLSVHEPEP